MGSFPSFRSVYQVDVICTVFLARISGAVLQTNPHTVTMLRFSVAFLPQKPLSSHKSAPDSFRGMSYA